MLTDMQRSTAKGTFLLGGSKDDFPRFVGGMRHGVVPSIGFFTPPVKHLQAHLYSPRPKLVDLVAHVSFRNLKTVRAYNICLAFQEFFSKPDQASGEKFLKQWYFWATHSRLAPIIRAAKTVKNHWEGVLNWFSSRITTGLLEGFNSLIQAAKARARGYRSDENLIAMAYLIAGRLNFGLPT
jgi:hypothetical protein